MKGSKTAKGYTPLWRHKEKGVAIADYTQDANGQWWARLYSQGPPVMIRGRPQKVWRASPWEPLTWAPEPPAEAQLTDQFARLPKKSAMNDIAAETQEDW